jgi:type IV secretory pathway TrbD component
VTFTERRRLVLVGLCWVCAVVYFASEGWIAVVAILSALGFGVAAWLWGFIVSVNEQRDDQRRQAVEAAWVRRERELQ